MEDTKQRILEKSLELFSIKGYDAVSVGEIAKAVGIKAPSLYNHFPSKQAIFDAILETTSAHYQKDTAEISVHVQDSQKDIPVFSHISEELLVEKVRQIFLYSLHDKTISQFRRMMTLERRARILRPSRPIMRPFISSLGSGTTDTVASDTCSAAQR